MDNSINDACRTVVYQLNGVSTEKENHFSSLAPEIMLGMPLIVGLSLPYGKIYGASKEFCKAPRGKGVSAWNDYFQRIKDEQRHLVDGNSRLNTIINKGRYKEVLQYEREFIPQTKNISFDKLKRLSMPKKLQYESGIVRKSYYSDVQRLVDEAKNLKGNELKVKLEEIRKAYAKAKLNEHNAIVSNRLKPVTSKGKIGRYLKNKSGYYSVKGKVLERATKSDRVGKFLRSSGKQLKIHGKGNLLWAAIAAVTEIPNIIDAYKIDKQEKQNGNTSNRGTKQLVKSGTKVTTSVLGYAAGAAAAGAIAGSVVPGLGNVAGAVIGFIGGCIGGAIASWGTEKIWNACTKDGDYGKSEAELYTQAQSDDIVRDVASNSAKRDELVGMAEEQMFDDDGNFLGDNESAEALKILLKDKEQRNLAREERIRKAQETCNSLMSLMQ